jgi:hypothetical protein
MPYLYRGVGNAHMPRQRWREQGANYWAITIENPAYGERHHGRVWRFDTPPAGAVVDSADMNHLDWAHWRQGSFAGAECRGATIVSGPNYRAYQTWGLSVPSPARFAGVRWWLSSTEATQDSLSDPVTVWATTTNPACGFTIRTVADEATGALATATRVGPRTVLLDSDFLAAHMEAALRRGGLFGYFLRSVRTVTFVAPEGTEPDYRPRLRIYFYRPAAEPARPAGPMQAGSIAPHTPPGRWGGRSVR